MWFFIFFLFFPLIDMGYEGQVIEWSRSSAKMWSSMLEKILVWNGGVKKWNGCVEWGWYGHAIKMTQTVCGMGCFLAKKAHVRRQYLQKVLKMWNGDYIGNSTHRRIVWSHPKCVGKCRVNPRWKPTHYGSFLISILGPVIQLHEVRLFQYSTEQNNWTFWLLPCEVNEPISATFHVNLNKTFLTLIPT